MGWFQYLCTDSIAVLDIDIENDVKVESSADPPENIQLRIGSYPSKWKKITGEDTAEE